MKLNKKYFLAVFIALGMQVLLGINLANAACETEIDLYCKVFTVFDKAQPYDKCYKSFLEHAQQLAKNPEEARNSYKYEDREIVEKETAWKGLKGNEFMANHYIRYHYAERCIAKAALDAPEQFKNAGSNQQNNTASNQSSNSGTSSNQTSSASQSNSPESYNIQVSQTNKQNYQSVQRAYEQANAGKGKKHNKEANATECMKNNPAQKTFKNTCNQAINFAYCFSGAAPGAKNENPQTLADLSCKNSQFGTLTIGAGESIPGSYKGLALDGLACKSPSQPVDMAFDRATNAATGRCSF